MYTPCTPLLYSKTGVCGGIPIFLIFAPKHRLWVLVRTASREAVLTCTHNLCFGAKIRKISKFFCRKFSSFKLKQSLFITWASFRNVEIFCFMMKFTYICVLAIIMGALRSRSMKFISTISLTSPINVKRIQLIPGL